MKHKTRTTIYLPLILLFDNMSLTYSRPLAESLTPPSSITQALQRSFVRISLMKLALIQVIRMNVGRDRIMSFD